MRLRQAATFQYPQRPGAENGATAKQAGDDEAGDVVFLSAGTPSAIAPTGGMDEAVTT